MQNDEEGREDIFNCTSFGQPHTLALIMRREMILLGNLESVFAGN